VHRRTGVYAWTVHRAGELYRLLLARRVHLLDAVLALSLTVLSNPVLKPVEWQVGGALLTDTTNDPQAAQRLLATWWAFTAVMVVGLLLQHRWPLVALALTSLGAAAHALARDPQGPQIEFFLLIDLAVPVTLYTLASRSRSRRLSAAALGVLMLAVIGVGVVNQLGLSAGPVDKKPLSPGKAVPSFELSVADIQHKVVEPGLTMLLVLALAFALGTASHARQAHLEAMEQRAADLERGQRQRIALATATERARIGRDLHDVVAHSLSVVVAQAQAALAAQHRHPERTTQAMREVITVGRESLAEMRRLVGAFGPAPDADHGLAPQVGIAALPGLVERVRAAGVPVRLTVTGPLADVPAGVDLSTYRIVQEALTNTLKHAAPGAEAGVSVTIRPDLVEVEVVDDGAGRPAGPPQEDGNGLRGIAERVHLLGGALTVGPEPGGGFAVRARLPMSSHPQRALDGTVAVR
jgi:signal transduction histidine kinase